jgi:hypothetical protein
MMNNHEKIAKMRVWSILSGFFTGIRNVEWFGRVRRGRRGRNARSANLNRSQIRLYGVRYKRLKQKKLDKSEVYAGLENADNDEFIGDESSSEDEVTALFNEGEDSQDESRNNVSKTTRISDLRMSNLDGNRLHEKRPDMTRFQSSSLSLLTTGTTSSRFPDFEDVGEFLTRHDSTSNMLSHPDTDDDLIDV